MRVYFTVTALVLAASSTAAEAQATPDAVRTAELEQAIEAALADNAPEATLGVGIGFGIAGLGALVAGAAYPEPSFLSYDIGKGVLLGVGGGALLLGVVLGLISLPLFVGRSEGVRTLRIELDQTRRE